MEKVYSKYSLHIVWWRIPISLVSSEVDQFYNVSRSEGNYIPGNVWWIIAHCCVCEQRDKLEAPNSQVYTQQHSAEMLRKGTRFAEICRQLCCISCTHINTFWVISFPITCFTCVHSESLEVRAAVWIQWPEEASPSPSHRLYPTYLAYYGVNASFLCRVI